MIIIYTGNGKGKTTAAFGLALRAAGWGKNIKIIQFIKKESWPDGARVAIRKYLSSNIDISAEGKGFVGIMGDTKPLLEHKKTAKQALNNAQKAILSKKYDVLVLDEILGALHGKLITKKQINSLFSTHLPIYSSTDLILTGRNAPKWLIAMADLVTEMKEIKHPFNLGIYAKKGIDF